jgi:hypothetical protein
MGRSLVSSQTIQVVAFTAEQFVDGCEVPGQRFNVMLDTTWT